MHFLKSTISSYPFADLLRPPRPSAVVGNRKLSKQSTLKKRGKTVHSSKVEVYLVRSLKKARPKKEPDFYRRRKLKFFFLSLQFPNSRIISLALYHSVRRPHSAAGPCARMWMLPDSLLDSLLENLIRKLVPIDRFSVLSLPLPRPF